MRRARKREHVENYLKTSFKGNTLLEDVYIEHNSLPELDFNEIDTSMEFLGKKIDFPIMINAMTGGAAFSQEINRDFARLSDEFNIPMAVGSQTIALEDAECKEFFKIVREIAGADRVVLSNLSGQATIEDAMRAMEMIDADAIQIHLNPAQELTMDEGDRSFKGIRDNIQLLVKSLDKPVIVKEVGFGISRNVAQSLYDIGVRNIDISGHGGTNFIEIENLRNPTMDFTDLYSWGIPTALSLINVRKLPKDLFLISSGGIRSSMDIVKSLVLGAGITAISGELLTYLIHGGYDNAREYLYDMIYKTKLLMVLMGKRNLEELRNADYKITGKLKDLISE